MNYHQLTHLHIYQYRSFSRYLLWKPANFQNFMISLILFVKSHQIFSILLVFFHLSIESNKSGLDLSAGILEG